MCDGGVRILLRSDIICAGLCLTLHESINQKGIGGGGALVLEEFLLSSDKLRVPTRPGKPGKMRVHLENLEISRNFGNFNKYHGKMT